MHILYKYDNIHSGAVKNGRTVALQSGSTSPVYIYGKLCRYTERRSWLMITISYEALIALVALCGGAGYLLGKDIHKAKK